MKTWKLVAKLETSETIVIILLILRITQENLWQWWCDIQIIYFFVKIEYWQMEATNWKIDYWQREGGWL